MNEVLQFFRENPTFFIATIDGDQARVRPFGAVSEFDGKLYIGTNNQKAVYKQLIRNPKVEICGMAPDGSYVRLEAEAAPDVRVEARAAMLEQNPVLKTMYSPEDGLFEVLYLKNCTASYWTIKGKEKEVKF